MPFHPSENPSERLEQMASLATALIATKTEFSNDLTYMPDMAPRSANCPILEQGGMQVKNKERYLTKRTFSSEKNWLNECLQICYLILGIILPVWVKQDMLPV